MMYGTLVTAAAYHAAVGNPIWIDAQYSDDQRTAAMVRARRVMDGRYGLVFTGAKALLDQPCAWPRVGAYDVCAQQEIPSDVTPSGILEASYEIALIELQRPNSLSPTINIGRLTKSESVDGAASRSFFSPEELAAFGNNPLQNMRPTLMVVEDLLSCFISVNGRRWAATVV